MTISYKRLLAAHGFQVVAVLWAAWITYNIAEARSDISAAQSEVSQLRQTVEDQETSEELEAIQKTVTRIQRDMPFR